VSFESGSDVVSTHLKVGKSNTSFTFNLDDIIYKVIDKKEFTVKLKKSKFLFFGGETLD
jgi:hypothetical protein